VRLPKVKAPANILTGHSDGVKCLAISPNGKILASGSQDKTIKLWELETGELINTLVGHWDEVNSIVFSADGQTLISCSRDERIQLWNLSTGKPLHSLSGHQGAVATVAITPVGHPSSVVVGIIRFGSGESKTKSDSSCS
jgi:WD40 repeat protein